MKSILIQGITPFAHIQIERIFSIQGGKNLKMNMIVFNIENIRKMVVFFARKRGSEFRYSFRLSNKAHIKGNFPIVFPIKLSRR